MPSTQPPFRRSLLTLAGAALLMACVEVPEQDPFEDEEGISIAEDGDEDEGSEIPDMPGGDEEEEQEAPTCETTTAVAANVPPKVMLVLDKSRSMVLNSWDDDGDAATPEVTRWSSLHGTVDTITGQYEQGMSLGLSLFPSSEATSDYDLACLTSDTPEVASGLGNAAAILAAIPAAEDMDLHGATPAAAGIVAALAHLETLAGAQPAAMILVTDGAANCGLDATTTSALFGEYDEDLPLIVADAYERAGIPTYVIGIDIQEESQSPFTNPREKLDEVAQLGGVAQAGEVGFYDATNADALTAALDDIAASVSCSVELGEAPSGPDELVVSINGEPLERLDSCDEGEGWIYADVEGDLRNIEMCNAACDALLDAGEIEAEFLCPPQP